MALSMKHLTQKSFILRLDNKTFVEIKRYAWKRHWTISQVIREAIRLLLKKKNGRP